MRRSLAVLFITVLVVLLPGQSPASAASTSSYDDPRGDVPNAAGDILHSDVMRNSSSPPENLSFQVAVAAFLPDEYLGDLQLTWAIDVAGDIQPDVEAVFGPDPRFGGDYSFRVVRRSDGTVVCDLDEFF